MLKGAFSQKQSNGTFLYLLVLLISLVLLSLSGSTNLRKPKEFGITFFTMFQKTLNSSGDFVNNAFNSISELREITKRYEDAILLIDSFQGIERELYQLEMENQQLRELLGFSEKVSYENISVEVTARDPGNLFSTIIINKGSRSGISPGMAVVTHHNGMMGLVGRVSEVGLNSSIVLPIIDENSYVAAKLQETRYEGLVQGVRSRRGSLVMEYVSKDVLSELAENDIVITSGMSSHFPSDIIIGRISNITSNEYSSTLELTLKPAVDFGRLDYMIVLKEIDND